MIYDDNENNTNGSAAPRGVPLGGSMRIIELERSAWDGCPVPVTYDSYGEWLGEPRREGDALSLRLVCRRAPRAHFEYGYALFSSVLAAPRVLLLTEGNETRALIELSAEPDGRLRIAFLYVSESYRRLGYGSLLMTKAREICRREHCRGIVLETDSRNSGAVAFFLRQGLVLVGCDLTACPDGVSRLILGDGPQRSPDAGRCGEG